MGCWKPCNQLTTKSFYYNCKIKNKQKTKKIVKPNSKQKKNKQTQKHKDTRRRARKQPKQDDFTSSTKLMKTSRVT